MSRCAWARACCETWNSVHPFMIHWCCLSARSVINLNLCASRIFDLAYVRKDWCIWSVCWQKIGWEQTKHIGKHAENTVNGQALSRFNGTKPTNPIHLSVVRLISTRFSTIAAKSSSSLSPWRRCKAKGAGCCSLYYFHACLQRQCVVTYGPN